MRKYKVEKRWTTKAGLRAVIVKQPGFKHAYPIDSMDGWFKDGWYCGYVGVPVDHPAYAKNYDDVPADVHGWLTFGRTSDDNYPIKTKEKLWWFGYDCAHLDDDIKIENLIYNINECELLARQLASIKSKQLNN